MITVLTPTYNRYHTLPRLCESLKSQTSKDFEWILVDDGSTDETKDWFKNIDSDDALVKDAIEVVINDIHAYDNKDLS
nr:glycosyltransferase family A protein [Tepidiphilus thermophilus]